MVHKPFANAGAGARSQANAIARKKRGRTVIA
jgi:hypothetical protein